MNNNIKIDSEFHSLIPPLSSDEYAQLEANIITDGCREPLVVWNTILLDGHNRFEICKRHNLPFKTISIELPNRDTAADWIDKNQLGRRNLTPDQMSLIRGRRYNRAKKGVGKPAGTILGQNDPISTADRLAKEHGVSAATIKRDAKIATFLNEHPEEAREIILGNKKFSDVRREVKRIDIISKLEAIETREVKAIEGVYDVIVIDPPWPMEKIERDVRPNQVEMDYPTMTEEELKSLRIPTAENSHVWLWTTHRFLPMAFTLLNSWKLKYICCFIWHKPGGFQPIGLPQYNCEFALYGRFGKPQFVDTKTFPVCFNAPRGGHSEKPEEFYDVVRRVTAGRRLDMFGRRKIEGFDSWGKEVE